MKIHEFAAPQGYSPAQVYKHEYKRINALSTVAYASMPLNTNGVRRLTRDHRPDTLANNAALGDGQLAYIHKHSLLPELNDALIVSPSRIGYRTTQLAHETRPWQEADYNVFWAAVIAGLSPTDIVKFCLAITTSQKVDWVIYNDKARAMEVRQAQFEAFYNLFLSALPKSRNPVKMLLVCLDAGDSFGSRFERQVAIELKVPTKVIKINPRSSHLPVVVNNTEYGKILPLLLDDKGFLLDNMSHDCNNTHLFQVIDA